MAKKLTDPAIRQYRIPEKREEVSDNTPGLILRVTQKGVKTFVFRYRIHGRSKRFTIGRYPGVSLSKARSIAAELNGKLAEGIDPQHEKRNPVQALTLSEVCNKYATRRLIELKPSTQAEYKRLIFKEIIPKIGNIQIDKVTRSDVIDLLDYAALDRKAPVLSNRIRSTLSAVFAFAVDSGIIEHNIVLGVKKKKSIAGKKVEKPRSVTYSDESIFLIYDAIQTLEEPKRSLFMILLLCGQRKTETALMQWSHIKKDVWTIPGELTKNKTKQVVPLSSWSMDIINKLKPRTGKSSYVFESFINRGKPVDTGLQKDSDRIKKRSGKIGFRIHDLRSIVASQMAKIGIERTVLAKVLNHKTAAGDHLVTALYDRYDYSSEKRQALQHWADALAVIVSEKKKEQQPIQNVKYSPLALD